MKPAAPTHSPAVALAAASSTTPPRAEATGGQPHEGVLGLAPAGTASHDAGDLVASRRPPTWVLLRGLTREAGHWGEFPSQLRSVWPGVQVMALDLPGNGRLWRQRSPLQIADHVKSVREQLATLQQPFPVGVLALSMGAMVAAEWARQHPSELAGVVLVNTSLRPFSPPQHRLRPARYPALLRLATGLLEPAEAERLVLQMTSSRWAHDERIVQAWAALRRQHPVSAGNALRQLWAAARYRAPHRPPPVQLLLLAGSGDTLVDPRCSRRLAARWNVPLREHPVAGHDLPLDDGPWLAQQVRAWWEQAAAGQP